MAQSSAICTAADALDPVIEEVRIRFVADFPLRCDTAARHLMQSLQPDAAAESIASLRALAHRITGLAGIIGFRRVSTLAADLEEVTSRQVFDSTAHQTATALIDALRAAFAEEVAVPLAPRETERSVHHGTVLLAEDDDEQRAIVTRHLEQTGYRVEGIASGDLVLEAARAVHPSVVLLDVEMPGIDGYSVCRELKADAALAAIPVLFLTTRTRLDDRLVGLTLGADDYLTKPIDLGELQLRIQRVCGRFRARAQEAAVSSVLSYEEFAQVARHRLLHSVTSLVLMRLSPEQLPTAASHVAGEIRRADLAGHYDRSHLMLFMRELSGAVAASRIAEIMSALSDRGVENAVAGISQSDKAGEKTFEAMLAEADEALVRARHFGRKVMRFDDIVDQKPATCRGLILIADDDPDVVRILDTQMRGAGYRTSVAFDGVEALDRIESSPPDVVIVDLMMPKMGGFDLLQKLHARQRRPKAIVLSARGREDDVTRAFELGADDYVTKPFNPQELLARVARLSR
jgi:two-component system, cell cycle response regulator